MRRKGSTPLSNVFYIGEETHGFKKALGCGKQLPGARSRHVGCITCDGAPPHFPPPCTLTAVQLWILIHADQGCQGAGGHRLACPKRESAGTLCADLLLHGIIIESS